jgi:hypothetical protein
MTSMRQTIDFLLNDWLRVDELTARPRFAEHSHETFGQGRLCRERHAQRRAGP